VVRLPHTQGRPVFPTFEASPEDPFLREIQASGKPWVLIAPEEGAPTRALDADGFLRAALFEPQPVNPEVYCHRPITVSDRRTSLDDVLGHLEAAPGDDVISRDLILLWGVEKRIITGADILGYLMRGIVRRSA
jgi:hypothetical protein